MSKFSRDILVKSKAAQAQSRGEQFRAKKLKKEAKTKEVHEATQSQPTEQVCKYCKRWLPSDRDLLLCGRCSYAQNAMLARFYLEHQEVIFTEEQLMERKEKAAKHYRKHKEIR